MIIMAENQQDLRKGSVDLMKGSAKVPDGLPLIRSTAKVVDLSNPQNVDEWIMAQVMMTGKTVNVVVDHTAREVKPSPRAAKTG